MKLCFGKWAMMTLTLALSVGIDLQGKGWADEAVQDTREGNKTTPGALTIQAGLDLKEFHNAIVGHSRGAELKAHLHSPSLSHEGLFQFQGHKNRTSENRQLDLEIDLNYSYFFHENFLGLKLKNNFEHRKDETIVSTGTSDGLAAIMAAGLLGQVNQGILINTYTERAHGVGLIMKIIPDEAKKMRLDFSLIPALTKEISKFLFQTADLPANSPNLSNKVVKTNVRMEADLQFNWSQIFQFLSWQMGANYRPKINETANYLAGLSTAVTISFGGPFSLKSSWEIDYTKKPELLGPKTNRVMSFMVTHQSNWL